jgi:hypothetical protein
MLIDPVPQVGNRYRLARGCPAVGMVSMGETTVPEFAAMGQLTQDLTM